MPETIHLDLYVPLDLVMEKISNSLGKTINLTIRFPNEPPVNFLPLLEWMQRNSLQIETLTLSGPAFFIEDFLSGLPDLGMQYIRIEQSNRVKPFEWRSVKSVIVNTNEPFRNCSVAYFINDDTMNLDHYRELNESFNQCVDLCLARMPNLKTLSIQNADLPLRDELSLERLELKNFVTSEQNLNHLCSSLLLNENLREFSLDPFVDWRFSFNNDAAISAILDTLSRREKSLFSLKIKSSELQPLLMMTEHYTMPEVLNLEIDKKLSSDQIAILTRLIVNPQIRALSIKLSATQDKLQFNGLIAALTERLVIDGSDPRTALRALSFNYPSLLNYKLEPAEVKLFSNLGEAISQAPLQVVAGIPYFLRDNKTIAISERFWGYLAKSFTLICFNDDRAYEAIAMQQTNQLTMINAALKEQKQVFFKENISEKNRRLTRYDDLRGNYNETPKPENLWQRMDENFKKFAAQDERMHRELENDELRKSLAEKLFAAVDKKNLKAVEEAVYDGADPRAQDKYGYTPITRAISLRQAEIIEFFLKTFPEEITTRDYRNKSILDTALPHRDDAAIQEIFRSILEGYCKNHDILKQWALFTAVAERNLFGLQMLIEKYRLNIYFRDSYGQNLLHYCAVSTNYSNALDATPRINIVKYLINQGVDFTAEDTFGYSPFYYFAAKKEMDVVRFLVEEEYVNPSEALQMAIDYPDEVISYLNEAQKRVPLFIAAKRGDIEGMAQALENGADCNARDVEGQTVAMVAARNGQTQAVRLLVSGPVSGEPYKTDHQGYTLLLIAVNQDNLDLIDYLVNECKVDVNSENQKIKYDVHHIGWVTSYLRPLLLAAYLGKIQTLKFLIESCGADIHITDGDKRSILQFIAMSHNIEKNELVEVVKFLLAKGANLHAKNYNGFTPLEYFAKDVGIELVKILIAEGLLDAQEEMEYAVKNKDKYPKSILTFLQEFNAIEKPAPLAENAEKNNQPPAYDGPGVEEMPPEYEACVENKDVLGDNAACAQDEEDDIVNRDLEDPVKRAQRILRALENNDHADLARCARAQRQLADHNPLLIIVLYFHNRQRPEFFGKRNKAIDAVLSALNDHPVDLRPHLQVLASDPKFTEILQFFIEQNFLAGILSEAEDVRDIPTFIQALDRKVNAENEVVNAAAFKQSK